MLQEEGIDCSCPRCADATEFNTGFGSVSCSSCPGFVSGKDESDWICNGCGAKRPAAVCTAILEKLNNILISAATDDKLGTEI